MLEDIDAIFVERSQTDSGGGGKKRGTASVSFSGLLNAIDGVAAQEGTSTYLLLYVYIKTGLFYLLIV